MLKKQRLPLSLAISRTLWIYFFLLSAFGRKFSYLHLQWGELPLYVGEFAFLLAFIWIVLQRERLKQVPKSVLFFGLAYLGIGLIHLLWALLWNRQTYGINRIFQDSGLHYEAIWLFFGFCFDEMLLLEFFSSVFLGVGFIQLWDWFYFAQFGHFSRLNIHAFGGLPGNEVVSPLFPLAFLIWPTRWVFCLVFVFGNSFLGQILIYLKKNWAFSLLAIVVPVSFFSRAWNPAQRGGGTSRARSAVFRARVFTAAVFSGLSLAFILLVAVGVRSFRLENGLSGQWSDIALDLFRNTNEFRSTFRRIIFDLSHFWDWKNWIFHNELVEDSQGHYTTMMAYRLKLWREAWAGFIQAPWTGQGFGPRMIKSIMGPEGKWISGPHNSFLAIAYRTGIPGVASVFGVLISATLFFWRQRRFDSVMAALLASFASLFLYALFNVCLENPQAGSWFWIFLGAIVSLSSKTPQCPG